MATFGNSVQHSNHASAWKEWLDENSSRLLMYARQRAVSMADAEDLVQDAVVKLWHYQEEKGHTPPDLALAFYTLRFIALDYGRKKERTKRRDDKIIEFNSGVDMWLDPSLEENEDAQNLRALVKALPDKLREVVTLKIWGELTFAQIGQALEISQNTAASRYRYAMEHLQKNIHLQKSRHA